MLNENATLADVLELLNKNFSTQDIADELVMSVKILEEKLQNAAIIYDMDTSVWKYVGGDVKKSLARKVKSKIVKIKVDKPFIIPTENNTPLSKANINKEYLLYKDSRNFKWEDLSAKKSFHLDPQIFEVIKKVSVDNSIKINVLVNVLLKNGLEHYDLL